MNRASTGPSAALTMSLLSGFAFLSHQVGSFMGVWLGGKLYDSTGSDTGVWWLAVVLLLLSATAGIVPGGVFMACMSPHLAVDLANRVWACF